MQLNPVIITHFIFLLSFKIKQVNIIVFVLDTTIYFPCDICYKLNHMNEILRV